MRSSYGWNPDTSTVSSVMCRSGTSLPKRQVSACESNSATFASRPIDAINRLVTVRTALIVRPGANCHSSSFFGPRRVICEAVHAAGFLSPKHFCSVSSWSPWVRESRRRRVSTRIGAGGENCVGAQDSGGGGLRTEVCGQVTGEYCACP